MLCYGRCFLTTAIRSNYVSKCISFFEQWCYGPKPTNLPIRFSCHIGVKLNRLLQLLSVTCRQNPSPTEKAPARKGRNHFANKGLLNSGRGQRFGSWDDKVLWSLFKTTAIPLGEPSDSRTIVHENRETDKPRKTLFKEGFQDRQPIP